MKKNNITKEKEMEKEETNRVNRTTGNKGKSET